MDVGVKRPFYFIFLKQSNPSVPTLGFPKILKITDCCDKFMKGVFLRLIEGAQGGGGRGLVFHGK